MDSTGSIKFMAEPESAGSITYLRCCHLLQGGWKYEDTGAFKKTYTGQYLHPPNDKMGVI